MSELPKGWAKTVPLFEICRPKQWKTVAKKDLLPDGYPVYGANGKIGFFSTYTHENPTVMITCRGASCGNIHISEPKSYINGNAMALDSLDSSVDVQYLFYALRFSNFDNIISGSAQPQITQEGLKSLNIPLPKLEEQKRIADKLDSVLAKVEAAQARLDKIPAILKRFRQSVLTAATSGELTKDWREENKLIQSSRSAYETKKLLDRQKWEENKLSEFKEKNRPPSNDKWKAKYKEPALPNSKELSPLNAGWEYFFVENIASAEKYSMSSGPFGSALGRKDYVKSGVPVLRGQNVKQGVAGTGEFVFVSENKALSIPRSLAYPGDIVVVAVGSSGVTGIVPQSMPIALLSQNCNKITVDRVIVNPEFFNLFLQSQVAQSQISAQTTDTVRQFFSLTNLKKTIIAVPPIQEQSEILMRVEGLFGYAKKVENQYITAKARLDRLTQSILSRAFKGELLARSAESEIAEIENSVEAIHA